MWSLFYLLTICVAPIRPRGVLDALPTDCAILSGAWVLQGSWFIRWAMVARLVRLGYNVLCVDTAVAVRERRNCTHGVLQWNSCPVHLKSHGVLQWNYLKSRLSLQVLEDVLPHLHSEALCGRFSLMFANDYDVGQVLYSGWV